MPVIRRDPPIGDRFWDTFRVLRPHDDVVLLPSPAPPAGTEDPDAAPDHLLDAEDLAAVRAATSAAVRELATGIGAPLVVRRSDDRPLAGGTVHTVRARSLMVLAPSEPPVLADVLEDLTRRGWSVTRRRGPVDRVVGRGPVPVDLPSGGDGDGPAGPVEVPVELVVSWAGTTGVLQVELVTVDLPVGAPAARALLDHRAQDTTPADTAAPPGPDDGRADGEVR